MISRKIWVVEKLRNFHTVILVAEKFSNFYTVIKTSWNRHILIFWPKLNRTSWQHCKIDWPKTRLLTFFQWSNDFEGPFFSFFRQIASNMRPEMDHATVSYDPTLPNDPITKAYDAIQTNVSVKCAQCGKFTNLLWHKKSRENSLINELSWFHVIFCDK